MNVTEQELNNIRQALGAAIKERDQARKEAQELRDELAEADEELQRRSPGFVPTGDQIKCNEDLVRNLMNYSPYGPLVQAFIMEAISKYAEATAKTKPEDYKSGGFINMEAWIGCAKDVQERLQKFYRRHEQAEKAG